MLRYAAIDIGSNAVRLLIADISIGTHGYEFKKNTLIRVPLRLGDDAFLNQQISDRKIEDMVKTMSAFKNLMDVYQVTQYLACATSAMREAGNGKEIVKLIKRKANINLEIIEGHREAAIISANHIEESLDANKGYLYIDVGGGSTELSVFVNKKQVASKSFNIGTIRILDNQDKPETWDEMHEWVKLHTKEYKIFKMSEEKEGHPMSFLKLKSMYNDLNSYPLKERIRIFKLNADRADVIIPASEIYITLMKWAGIKQIYVPRVGMVDGIINLLMEENLPKI
jgi:exopolyphosphatase/guanosine-5'-triphosphate,3'-diphosphate pyrophosphatase